MCCFHPGVQSVRRTKIFARSGADGRQFLVYAMKKSSVQDVAMILPLPVPAGGPEDAVRFIDLKEYPALFDDLDSGWPNRKAEEETGVIPRAPLEVVDVGDFEASFVPSAKDFDRVDPRFRIPAATLDALPVKGFGFAVFKLKKGADEVHPMAFDFPRADRTRLFFPTIHVHDGKVHPTADFDHILFCQAGDGERLGIRDWETSPLPARAFADDERAKGVLDPNRPVHRLLVKGPRKNEDILV